MQRVRSICVFLFVHYHLMLLLLLLMRMILLTLVPTVIAVSEPRAKRVHMCRTAKL